MKQIAALCACAMISWVPLSGQIALPQGVTPASQKSTDQIQRCAAELLSRYTKQKDGNFLSKLNNSSRELWVESNGLVISRVTPYHMTPADHANGISAIYMVSVDSKLYRTYDSNITLWTEWKNGRYLLLPNTIRVTKSNSGLLTAESSTLSQFIPFTARGNPDLIPCVPERVIQKPVAIRPIQFPTPKSSPASEERPVQPNRMQDASQLIVNKAIQMAAVIAILLTIAGVLAAALGDKRKKARTRPTLRTSPTIRQTLPPPLPADASPTPDHSSLIVGHTHLLTPAEQSFLAVLETIVRPTCAISTKVRLADLFQVKLGRGHQSAFNRISRKHVDFVLTDPATTRILCAIELDDSSHNRPDRIARDQFVDELFANNQMPLVHIPFEWKYNPSAIRGKLVQAGVLHPPIVCISNTGTGVAP